MNTPLPKIPVQKQDPNVRSLSEEWLEEFFETDPVSIRTGSWRWGSTETYVAEIDGEHWMFSVRYHCEDGRQREPEVAYKVKAVEVTTTQWVRVN